MASGTADLQRDLGGAIMQSILGALLTAGYASAMAASIASAPQSVTDSTQSELTKSFSSAAALAEQNPKYADQIIAAAKSAFLDGDQWAYTAALSPSCSARSSSPRCSRAATRSRSCSQQYHAEDDSPPTEVTWLAHANECEVDVLRCQKSTHLSPFAIKQ